MKLQKINLQEPDHIAPEDINTYEKCQENEFVSLHMTKGRGRNHGKRYYSGSYKSKDLPVKIDGKLFKSVSIETTKKGEIAEVKPYIPHDYNRLKKLAEAFNDRFNGKYAQDTQRLWKRLINEHPEYEAISQRKKLARWLQLYSYVEFGQDGRLSKPKRFIYSNKFTSDMYGMLENCIPLPDSSDWKAMKPFWKKAADINFQQEPAL